jgi:hypothetical protein
MTISTRVLCYYAECRILFTIVLNVIMLSVVILNVFMLSAVMLCVVAPFGVHSHNLSRTDPVYESVYFTYDVVIVFFIFQQLIGIKIVNISS